MLDIVIDVLLKGFWIDDWLGRRKDISWVI